MSAVGTAAEEAEEQRSGGEGSGPSTLLRTRLDPLGALTGEEDDLAVGVGIGEVVEAVVLVELDQVAEDVVVFGHRGLGDGVGQDAARGEGVQEAAEEFPFQTQLVVFHKRGVAPDEAELGFVDLDLQGVGGDVVVGEFATSQATLGVDLDGGEFEVQVGGEVVGEVGLSCCGVEHPDGSGKWQVASELSGYGGVVFSGEGIEACFLDVG